MLIVQITKGDVISIFDEWDNLAGTISIDKEQTVKLGLQFDQAYRIDTISDKCEHLVNADTARALYRKGRKIANVLWKDGEYISIDDNSTMSLANKLTSLLMCDNDHKSWRILCS